MYGAGGRAEDSQVASTGKSRNCSIFEELRIVLMSAGEERRREAFAHMAVCVNAQSCWPQCKWTGGGRRVSLPSCKLSTTLKCRRKKQEQMPFPLFVVLIPVLKK